MPLSFWIAGRRAERRAARYLRRRGYRIMARNIRTGEGEIDILASKGGLLIVVEVRLRRGGFEEAEQSVDRKKLKLLMATFRSWRHRYPELRNLPVRIDLLLSDGRNRWVHMTGVA